MKLFVREQNELADRIARSDLTVYLHTAEPTDASPDNGRATIGGGDYESGATYSASDISNASGGDITFNVDIPFGTADEAVGTVIFATFYRGSADAVGYIALPSTTDRQRRHLHHQRRLYQLQQHHLLEVGRYGQRNSQSDGVIRRPSYPTRLALDK